MKPTTKGYRAELVNPSTEDEPKQIPEKVKALECSICHGMIPRDKNGWEEGNNAEPVNSGRCCNECNTKVVIPVRIQMAMGSKKGN